MLTPAGLERCRDRELGLWKRRVDKIGQECRSRELLGVQDREPGSSLVPQTTPIRPLASNSASLTTNVLMQIQVVNKYGNEIVNVGAEAAGCPLMVTSPFFLTITMLIWWGSTMSRSWKALYFQPFCRLSYDTVPINEMGKHIVPTPCRQSCDTVSTNETGRGGEIGMGHFQKSGKSRSARPVPWAAGGAASSLWC